MRAFLKNIRRRSYFGELIASRPDLDPHGDVFMDGLLRNFEEDLSGNGKTRSEVFGNILGAVSRKDGKYVLGSLRLYEPNEADLKIMKDVARLGGPYWLIPAQVYRAIISRDLAKRDRRLSRGVSRRTLEDCAERIMQNVGVLLVNEDMMQGDTADGVVDLKRMFPMLRAELAEEAGKKDKALAEEILADGKLSQDISFALWWYYMVSSSFTGPDDPHFPVFDTDRPDTWEKIQSIMNSLPSDPTDDELIVFINRFIDLCHGRGSLAGAFVEGGAATCAAVSNMGPDELYEGGSWTR